MSDQPEERRCESCLAFVDEEGNTTGECSWVQAATCEECGACLCDGSC